MALWKVTAKPEQLLALALFAVLLSSLTAAQGSEDSSVLAQWTCSVAPKLDLGTKYYGYLESSTDVHWFKWNLPSSGKFVAELEVPSGLDYDLKVYSSCSSHVCTSGKGASQNEKCEVDAKAGWIYAKIYGYNGAFSKTKKYYIKGSFTASTKYDLAPSYVDIKPPSPSDKDFITATYSAVNLGPDDIENKNVYTQLSIDGEAYPKCGQVGLKYLDYIKCQKGNIKLGKGWHTVKNTADPDNEVQETDETNNEHQQDLFVSHKAEYDLAVTDIWTSPGGELNDKMTFKLNADVKNIGADDIGDSFEVKINVDDKDWRTCTFSSLDAGETGTCSFENQKWKAGTHVVLAYADIPGRKIAESNENNNEKKAEFDVIHIPETDIVVTNIYADPVSLTEKDTFSVKIDLKNAGSEAVPPGFKTNVFINGEPKGTWCYTVNLGAGATETCAFAKQKWAAGSYKVKAVADAENVINELVENNNELEKTIEVKQYCPVPDGSAADCDCNSGKDCPSGYYCGFKEGYDACMPIPCKNECSQAGYFCGKGDVYECGNFDSDPCMESKLKQACNLYSQKCNPAKGSCDNPPSPLKQLRLEDAPSHATLVYKQPGDSVEITITSDTLQDVEFSQPENFTLLNGICSGKAVAVGVGETKCLFQISETTAAGKYFFTANEKTAAVEVIDKPKAIIVTNKEKLSERFSNDKAGVKSLLEQAFQYASSEGNTVVYYLDKEVEGHPFLSFNYYKETFAVPKLTDNTYASKVADFVKSRCGDCSILLLGDDFIVPFHRHAVANEKGVLWWKDLETSNIYTDLPYNSLKLPTFSRLDYDEYFQSGPVAIIIPSYMGKDDADLLALKKALVDTYHYFKLEQNKECSPIYFSARTVTFPHYCKGECFNPNGCEVGNKNLTSVSEIEVLQSQEVGCNSFGKLEGKTLVIIGSKETNQAMACFPWVQGSEYPLISLQRNVWDGSKGAVLLNLPQEHKSLGMYVLAEVLARGKVYTYIQTGSDFEIIPFLTELVPLSTCDDAAIIDKNGIHLVEPDSMLFCLMDIPTLGKASIIGVVGKGGKVSKAATAPVKVAKEYKRLYELGKKAGKEADMSKLLGKAPTSLPYISLKFEKYGKPGSRQAFDTFMEKALPEAAAMTEKDFGHFVKGLDTLARRPPFADISKYPVDDIKNVGKGAGYIEKNIKGGLDSYQKSLAEADRLRALKTIGVYVDDVIGKYTHVLYEPKQGIFAYRGIRIFRLPIKDSDGQFINWAKIKEGYDGINVVEIDLNFIKKLPEAERKEHAKLSLSQVHQSHGIFIPTSKLPSVAKGFAETDGFVFIINPRAGNVLDLQETILLQLNKKEITYSAYQMIEETINKEFELSFIEKIDIEDFLGTVRVKNGEIVKGSFDKNPYYRPDTPNDISIALKETGA